MSNDIERGATPQQDRPGERDAAAGTNGRGDGDGDERGFNPFAPRAEQLAAQDAQPTTELPRGDGFVVGPAGTTRMETAASTAETAEHRFQTRPLPPGLTDGRMDATHDLSGNAAHDASFDPYSPEFGRPRTSEDRGPRGAQDRLAGEALPGRAPLAPPQSAGADGRTITGENSGQASTGHAWSIHSPEQRGAPAPAPTGSAGIPSPSAFGLGATPYGYGNGAAPAHSGTGQPAASAFPPIDHGAGAPNRPHDASAWASTSGAPAAGAYASAPGAPAMHPGGAYAAPPRKQKTRAGSMWVAVMASALLAAGLASGGTYAAVTASGGGSSVSSQASSPVVQQASTGTIDWATVATAVKSSVVSIVTESSQSSGAGSGVVWDDQGHIVTNYHVIADAQSGGSVHVLVDNTAYSAKVVGSDPTTDLAVLKLDNVPGGLTPITRGDSTKLSVGQEVMAVGNPLGLSGSVTTGIVSALDRPVTTGTTQDSQVVTNAIQTSAPLNPGNSGGALVDASGRLIGINSAIATLGGSSGGNGSSSQSGSIGIGFAIPVSQVENIVDQLVQSGSAQHAMLGASAKDGSAQQGSDTVLGAQIANVQQGSAAASAGIKAGDLVTAVDDKPISGTESLVATIREHRPGEQATISVIRGGQRMTFTVTLGSDASGK